jgi:hypothetical protein
MPKDLQTSKKESAARQLRSAVAHFENGDLDCAITLAGAAEGILPDTDDPYLFKMLRNHPDVDFDLNLVVNWLKHPVGPEETIVGVGEATIVIARAISKFIAVYHQSTERFEQFLSDGHKAGILPKPR